MGRRTKKSVQALAKEPSQVSPIYTFKSAKALHIEPDYVVLSPTPLGQRKVSKPGRG